MRINHWKAALQQFAILFEDRLSLQSSAQFHAVYRKLLMHSFKQHHWPVFVTR